MQFPPPSGHETVRACSPPGATHAKAADMSAPTTTPTLSTEEQLRKVERLLAEVEQRLERISPTVPTPLNRRSV